jgi:hypothetical protein
MHHQGNGKLKNKANLGKIGWKGDFEWEEEEEEGKEAKFSKVCSFPTGGPKLPMQDYG